MQNFDLTTFRFDPQSTLPTSTEFSASCPSNIALVKYWGKTGLQIPTNASLSFTLSHCRTHTHLKFNKKSAEESRLTVFFHGIKNESFQPKIKNFFANIAEFCPYLNDFDIEIRTENSFPHSSGIASSASGMGALALCLMEFERKANPDMSHDFFLQKASFLARLGSGSASRSVYPGVVVWGQHPAVEGSSNLFGVPLVSGIHEVFKTFCDYILLIDVGEKKVSSSAGHNLMNSHPYAQKRFEAANQNLSELINMLKDGDLDRFGEMVEHEALSLHAMMLTSHPAFVLMRPNTLTAIEKVWDYRQNTGQPLFFTLDAGANLHLIFPKSIEIQANEFIQKELAPLCKQRQYIKDEVAWF